MISLYDIWKSREPLMFQHDDETPNNNETESDNDCENVSDFVMI